MQIMLTNVAARHSCLCLSLTAPGSWCRAVVAVAAHNEKVYSFVGREMLRGSIAALAHPIFTASETLQLIRDILAQQLASSPGPKQVSQAFYMV